MRARVLVIDDDPMLMRLLRRGLQQEGYPVTSAGTIGEARQHLDKLNPEIVLLDLMPPDGDGRDFCRELRDGSERLILVLSARREVAERIALLDQGADDYLVKPFSFGELTAHLRALTRRTRAGSRSSPAATSRSISTAGKRAAGSDHWPSPTPSSSCSCCCCATRVARWTSRRSPGSHGAHRTPP